MSTYTLISNIEEGKLLNGLHSKDNFDTVKPLNGKPSAKAEGLSIAKTSDSLRANVEDGDLNTPILTQSPNLYKQTGAFVSKRFIKLNPCEATLWLMAKHPNAYLLLNLVAIRAERIPNHPSGLEVGESLIGDHEAIGATRQEYRTALKVLVRMKYLTISETCRNRKKVTTGITTVGTKVKLLNSDIWDINIEEDNHRINHRATTEQPPSNHDQEEVVISNISHITMSDSQTHQTKVTEKIFFDWQEMKIKGIDSSDLETWKATFTHVDVPEYLKFIEQDIGAKPTKYKKRKQIVKTILIYFQNKNENNARFQKTAKQQYQKPESLHNKPFNKDTSPKKYNNTYDFSQPQEVTK